MRRSPRWWKDPVVPIIAVCPYCQIGRVRAPERAVGATANCPRCHSSFTVVDSGETEEIARRLSAASPGIELKTAPEGYVKLHENHHLWSKTRIGQGQLDGTFKVVAESPELIEPNPFPKGYQ